jgi:hypothetical protein
MVEREEDILKVHFYFICCVLLAYLSRTRSEFIQTIHGFPPIKKRRRPFQLLVRHVSLIAVMTHVTVCRNSCT